MLQAMNNIRFISALSGFAFLLACNIPKPLAVQRASISIPQTFGPGADTTTLASQTWRQYFSDGDLIAIIDSALRRNQELVILEQEMAIRRNEVRARKGEYLPFLGIGSAAGLERTPRYTRNGAVEEGLPVKGTRAFPDPLGDVQLGAALSWEVDVWKKLRNARQAAVFRYLNSVEGKRFAVTRLVAEVAASYYEWQGLFTTLGIIDQNISLQSNALEGVRQQKESAKVTQLAVNRFEAQLLHTRALQYEVRQRMTEAENRLRFLSGNAALTLKPMSGAFSSLSPGSGQFGVPAQLLRNRPDIRQAEFALKAAQLDVKSARAAFLPSVRITAGLGFQAFNPVFLLNPASLAAQAAGDLVAPLVNRNAISAAYLSANAQQVQTAVAYEQRILNAYVEVLNEVARLDNFSRNYQTKEQEVEILLNSVSIANSLFNSARADYIEVLTTQREALEAKLDLVDIKLRQMEAKVNLYRALGGGWQ
jgi:NodT family efflux transporter outer membrane factor (OMF) lipoprotein